MYTIIVGNTLRNNALAAVGASTALINLLISFSQGLAVGTSVLISQAISAKNNTKLKQVIYASIACATILGIILSLFCFSFSNQLLIQMQTPQDILETSITYLKIYSLGLIFNIIYNMLAGILNAVGNSKRSLYYLIYASITNIVLNFIFILYFHLGVAGAALATTFSQAISSILALYFLLHTKESYHVDIKSIFIYPQSLIEILKAGLPTGIQNMVISFSNVLVQSTVNQFGTTTVAAFSIYMKIDGFNILPITSLSMAATTFTAQNYGNHQIDRVYKGMKVTLLMTLLYSILTGVCSFNFSHPILSLFTQDL